MGQGFRVKGLGITAEGLGFGVYAGIAEESPKPYTLKMERRMLPQAAFIRHNPGGSRPLHNLGCCSGT